MNELRFFLQFAIVQARHGGVGGVARPIDIQRETEMSRKTIYKHLNNMMDLGLIEKEKRGQYRLSSNEYSQSVGLCTLTPIDIIEYRTDMIMGGIASYSQLGQNS